MPTLIELRSSIRNQIIGQVGTDDTRYRSLFIDHEIRAVRSILINQQGRSGLGVDPAYYQELTCLTIEEGSVVCEGYDSGESLLYVTMPAVEGLRGAIAYLGTIDGRTAFQRRSISSFMSKATPRFCKPFPNYAIIGDRAYVRDVPSGLEFLRMVAVLEDPAKNKCVTDFERQPYPIPQNRVHELEVICIKQLLATLPIQPDSLNDAADSSQQQGRPNAEQLT